MSDIQPYFTEVIRPDIRQFSLLYQTKLTLSGRISGQTEYHPTLVYNFNVGTLAQIANNETDIFERKKLQLSLAKLAALAADEDDKDSLLQQLDADIVLQNAQVFLVANL